jgi:uncharacterized HAD superfamily protein
MKIVVDLDGTICEEMPTFEKALAKPKKRAIRYLNSLSKKGHFIIIYTARGWAEYNMTYSWLNEHSIPFDVLMMGKPIYDIWIDDRAIKFTSWDNIKCELDMLT